MTRYRIVLTVLVAALGWSATLGAHSNREWDSLRLTLLTWGNALVAGDAVAMAPVLHSDFRGETGLDRASYLERVKRNSLPLDGLFLRFAAFEIDGQRATVGPVVIATDLLHLAYRVELQRVGDLWQLVALLPTNELPPELTQTLPEHSTLRRVVVQLRDATSGQPVAARVHVAGDDGEYWPPEGHMRNIATGWREDVGRDVRVADKTWAYVPSEFSLPVPEGSYRIEIERGLEYESKQVRFEVDGNEPPPLLTIELERWANMAAEGWYSGDTHVHFLDPSSAIVELEGEDLNVLNILATKWGELITNVEHFTGAPSLLSKENRIVYVGEESRHGYLGHTVLLDIGDLIYPLTWGGPSEGVVGGFDYPPMAHQADKAHAHGGFVSWAHFPGPGGEVAIDTALGKIDSVDLFTWGDAFAEQLPQRPSTARIWYRLLNCGFDLPATAGTDKMLNTQVSGSVRTYVEVEGALTYDGWIEGIRRGRTFVTTGPLIELEVDGRGIGSRLELEPGQTVTVRAAVRSRQPVAHLEIVQDGEVIERLENPERRRELELQTTASVESSSWLAARAYSPELQPYQIWDYLDAEGIPLMAHTSPVYLDVAVRPRRSAEAAAFFIAWCDRAIEWARTRARFLEESQRREMIDLFESARSIYAAQLDVGR